MINEIAVLRIVPLAETLQLSNKMGEFLFFPFIYQAISKIM